MDASEFNVNEDMVCGVIVPRKRASSQIQRQSDSSGVFKKSSRANNFNSSLYTPNNSNDNVSCMPLSSDDVTWIPLSSNNTSSMPLTSVTQSVSSDNQLRDSPDSTSQIRMETSEYSSYHILHPLSSLAIYKVKSMKFRSKRRCKMCSRHCSYFCTKCSDIENNKLASICNPFTIQNRKCYFQHCEKMWNLEFNSTDKAS